MDVEVPDGDPYLKQGGGREMCFGMLTLIKSNGLGGKKVGTSIFLTKERSSVPHVTRGGRGALKSTQLGLSEDINLVGGGCAIRRTNLQY